jgi:hypothetical protein
MARHNVSSFRDSCDLSLCGKIFEIHRLESVPNRNLLDVEHIFGRSPVSSLDKNVRAGLANLRYEAQAQGMHAYVARHVGVA